MAVRVCSQSRFDQDQSKPSVPVHSCGLCVRATEGIYADI